MCKRLSVDFNTYGTIVSGEVSCVFIKLEIDCMVCDLAKEWGTNGFVWKRMTEVGCVLGASTVKF